MSKSVEDIIELVNIIKNETETNANSAERIASVFLDILEFCKLADTDNAGIMSAEDKAKLNGIAAGAQKNPGAATSASDGLMSRSDKIKLDKCDFFTDEPFRFEPTDDSVELVVDMENHLYEGNYIPVASQTQAGIMTAADKAALDNAPVNINLYNHMSSSKPLPTLHAVFNYYGNLVHFRSVYHNNKWYHIFCVPHQEESGASTMYILYDDTLKYYGKLFKEGLRSDFMWVARAFGDADATTEFSGQMSAADKAKLNGIEAGAQKNPSVATSASDGLMSAADKLKLDGINETLNLIEQKIAIKTVLDANSILTSGTYYLKNAANTPSDTCYIEVIAADPNFIVQKSIDTDGVEKKRVYTNNVWSTWK